MGFHAAYNHQQIGHWDDFSQPSQIQLATDKSMGELCMQPIIIHFDVHFPLG